MALFPGYKNILPSLLTIYLQLGQYSVHHGQYILVFLSRSSNIKYFDVMLDFDWLTHTSPWMIDNILDNIENRLI